MKKMPLSGSRHQTKLRLVSLLDVTLFMLVVVFVKACAFFESLKLLDEEEVVTELLVY